MADFGSLRVKRHRLHARGDHSLCKRCAAKRAQVANLAAAWDAAALPGAEDASVAQFSPRAMMEALAQRLEEAHKADPADSGVARELRMTLQALGAAGGGDDELSGFLDDFRNA
jgi:hypothetical protein